MREGRTAGGLFTSEANDDVDVGIWDSARTDG